MLNLGKVTAYMEESSPYFQSIKNILFELSSYDNILVSEPACYALVNTSLIHKDLVCIDTKKIIFLKLIWTDSKGSCSSCQENGHYEYYYSFRESIRILSK